VRLVLLTLPIALVAGTLAGGRISRLASLPVRSASLAAAGIALQFIPSTGAVGSALLVASFVLLVAFAARNLSLPGFPLILLGLVLNLTVIALNDGMPVGKHALVRSGQGATLASLRASGGAKHHLASKSDRLLPLGDVLALPPPVQQAVSVGDIATHSGIVWLVVWGMLRVPAPARSTSNESGSDPPAEPRLIGAARKDA
jgi:hypothetical protein